MPPFGLASILEFARLFPASWRAVHVYTESLWRLRADLAGLSAPVTWTLEVELR